MHAQRIIQKFLDEECPSIHVKRRAGLALVTDAAQRGGLTLLRLSRQVRSTTALRHRIKQCDRLLSNGHLESERPEIYRALARRLLHEHRRVAIIVDWSDLLKDVSQHVLRATVVLEGRSFVIYEEIHDSDSYNVAAVHGKFMETLRTILPERCEPIIITDAGFRGTWFRMLNELKFAWIGRVRNREKMLLRGSEEWVDCQQLYPRARKHARDLGIVDHVKSAPVKCRMVLTKKDGKGRQNKTAFGEKKQSAHSKKQAKGQREPWLLAVSTKLAFLDADEIVKWYEFRMQIEQTFRDLKNPQWGMGLRNSQTRKPRRLKALLLIAALLSFAFWLIGLAALARGFRIQYGSLAKTSQTASILTLARRWIDEHQKRMTLPELAHALTQLRNMIKTYDI